MSYGSALKPAIKCGDPLSHKEAIKAALKLFGDKPLGKELKHLLGNLMEYDETDVWMRDVPRDEPDRAGSRGNQKDLMVLFDATEVGNWTRYVRLSEDQKEANVEFVTVSVGGMGRLVCRVREEPVLWGSELVAFVNFGKHIPQPWSKGPPW